MSERRVPEQAGRHAEAERRRPVTASGSLSIDLGRFAEYVATMTAARVIQALDSRPNPKPPEFRPVEPGPVVDPALREEG